MTDLRAAAEKVLENADNLMEWCAKNIHTWDFPQWDSLHASLFSLRQALAQPEQGCAECGVKASDGYALYCVKCTDLFTQPKHPPVPAGLIDPKSFYEGYEAGLAKRSWVGLTDEEIDDLDNFDFDGYGFPINFARAIEAKLKEKNT